MLKKNDLVENRYRVIRPLGGGGMSCVYLVNDSRLDNRWVLKEFTFSGTSPDESRVLEQHFINEAKICARMSHPGIPRVIDYFSHQDKHYLVEEYVRGRTLMSMVESAGRLKQQQVIAIVLQLCDVLEYIHSQNIIYRDLKPENVMIQDDGNLKLIDFGIARVHKTGKSKDTVVMGTPGFASPEQYGTAQTDVRSDIYSLGALIHHMLTGRDPREKPFTFEPPSQAGIDISTYLENVIMKSLSLKTEDRYSSIKQFREAVMAAAEEMGMNGNLLKISAGSALSFRKTEDDKDKDEPQPVEKDSDKEKDRKSADSDAKGKAEKSPFNKILVLVYGVLFFMLFALMFELKFNVWVIIPYILVTWLIVVLIFKFLWK